ncbi:protein phosphatase 1 regulatory subunit 14C [Callorhinchus milii]|uniref:Protein phosphatase 1 regulatory inhibitor subunit 14D n=1 Tax=Callorhinchus milii TaxID=7868 RepID=V9LEN8_CALMI|nr:protein phosphatase 1 regulatory subunit 14C [Callorhinchus milii]|eukprot:gi/632951606/ref/XP_007891395.1/ PREDICTED: protein phosphatase 1 regulatory subunit 14D [Callorhinchus milii]
MAEPSTQSRVYFQAASKEEEQPTHRKMGKFTVKYDRKDLQKRLEVEEWMDVQIRQLLGCKEEETPVLEIDVDELLELPDEKQRSKLQAILQGCCKPTDDFINELLIRIKGLRKMTTPQKK